jgi:hypothetical protein
VQTPTTTAIVSETIHDARIIRMSGTHSPAVITSWLGDSVGWWEHDTTRVSDYELNYIFTVSDPTYYTRSWTGETHLLRSKHKMFEYACHEGNYSMRNILEAARQ